MKVCVLGSGSKGNCTYIEGDKSKILIDCGLSCLDAIERLKSIDVNPQEIDAILVTHEHSDHIKGVGSFAKKFGTQIISHNACMQKVVNRSDYLSITNYKDCFDGDFFIKDLTITSFAVPHDVAHCSGFSVYNNGKKVTIATDLGEMQDSIFDNLKESDLVILESNHDPDLLKANIHYPAYLKKRILSNVGHLSNQACGDTILKLAKCDTLKFVLAHLSQENNTSDIARLNVQRILNENGLTDKDYFLEIASQTKRSSMIEIK